MYYKKLLLSTLLLLSCIVFTKETFAAQEAGESAKLIAEIDRKDNLDSAEMNIKRKVIYEVLSQYKAPLETEVDAFIATCTKYKIDCYLLPSIAGLESSFGRYTHPGSHNPFGWGGGYLVYDSWEDCIDAVGKGIRENYIDKWGADTIERMGPIYAASPTWAVRVRYFHNKFEQVEQEKRLYFSKLKVEL